MSDWHQQLWSRDGPHGPAYRALFSLLGPAEWAFRFGVAARSWAYDRGLLSSARSPIPTLAVGNLTVGGTGKTPLTAWLAGSLNSCGTRTAIVMRGYGADEDRVHRLLNPDVPVYVSADRVAGVKEAHASGAEVAVLDDAFQHRALRADAYIVLFSAEEWNEAPHLLPRGPWREPLSALDRAGLIVTTRKVAPREESARVSERLAELQPLLPRADAYIGLSGLARYDRGTGCLEEAIEPEGFRCGLAVAGVAKPETVWTQLEVAGLRIEKRRAFSDHHRYSEAEVSEIGEAAGPGPLVATLKDAVKLAPALPPGIEMYVALQSVVWESGADKVDQLIANLAGGSQRLTESQG
jgi:tetraacyldisaccharide 4'-kinase